MSFRLKTVLGIACIEALLLTILVISGLHYLSSSNATQLQQRAATTAKLVATMTSDAVIAFDLATLDTLVEQALKNPDLVYLRIRASSGSLLSEGGNSEALKAAFIEDETIDDTSSDQRFDISAPIDVAGSSFGRVELGLSTTALDATFMDALFWMVGLALSEMILVALLGLALGHYLTRQLFLLKRGAKQVASGEFGYQIPISGRDELSETAESFNSMSLALARFAKIADDARKRAEEGRALAESTLQDALDSMRDHVLVIGEDGRVLLANRSYRAFYKVEKAPSSASDAFEAEAHRNGPELEGYVETRRNQLADPTQHPRWKARLTDGSHLLIAQHPMSNGGIVIVQTDVSELYQALEENKQLQQELMQKQKTEAVATLAGGLAHEINTPVQIIADNTTFVAEAIGEIVQMVNVLKVDDELDGERLTAKLDKLDWDYMEEELPGALADMTEGTARVREMISSFKQFATQDGKSISLAPLDDLVSSIIDDTRSTWERFAEIETSLSDKAPLVPCQVEQIKQVVRHLIVNAAHAIEDSGNAERGRIAVRTTYDDDHVTLEIEDSGCGIAADDLDRIYDALFTTKEPGRGTGQGLTLAHNIVTRGHGGRIDVRSKLGEGTCFSIRLPLSDRKQEPSVSEGQPTRASEDVTQAVA